MPDIAYLDFETQSIGGTAWPPPKPVGVALFLPGRPPRYLSWGAPAGNNVTPETAGAIVRDTFKDFRVVMHNSAFDLAVADYYFGARPIRGFEDSMIEAWLLDPYSQIGAKDLADNLFHIPPTEQEQLHDWIRQHLLKGNPKPNPAAFISQVPGHLVAPYAIGDVERSKALHEYLGPRVAAAGMGEALRREYSVIPIAIDMTRRGVLVDQDGLNRGLPGWRKDLEALDDALRVRLGAPGLNPGSIDQLADALERSGLVNPGDWKRSDKGKL